MSDLTVKTGTGVPLSLSHAQARHRLSIGDPLMQPLPGSLSMLSSEPALVVQFREDERLKPARLTPAELLRVLDGELTDKEVEELRFLVGEHSLWDR